MRKIDSTYILRDQQDNIIGVLSKTEYFFLYVDLYKKWKGFISQNEAFAYIIECLKNSYKSTNKVSVTQLAQTDEQSKKNPKKSVNFKKLFKKK